MIGSEASTSRDGNGLGRGRSACTGGRGIGLRVHACGDSGRSRRCLPGADVPALRRCLARMARAAAALPSLSDRPAARPRPASAGRSARCSRCWIDVPWLWPAMRDALSALKPPARRDAGRSKSQTRRRHAGAVLLGVLLAGTAPRYLRIAFALLAPAAWVAARIHAVTAAAGGSVDAARLGFSCGRALAQIADLGGVYAVSFVVALPSAAVACARRSASCARCVGRRSRRGADSVLRLPVR